MPRWVDDFCRIAGCASCDLAHDDDSLLRRMLATVRCTCPNHPEGGDKDG